MLYFIGTGSAFNTSLGNTSAFCKYKNGEVMLLMDCGEDVFGKIKRYHLLDSVKTLYVCITHTHSDHVGSLATLISYCKLVKDIDVIIVESTPENMTSIARILDIMGILPNMYRISTCEYVRKFINTVHTPVMDNVMYHIVDNESRECLYTGDTNELDTIVKYRNDNRCYVYHDTSMVDYEGNPHLSYSGLKKNKGVYSYYYTAMHIESDDSLRIMNKDNHDYARNIHVIRLLQDYNEKFRKDDILMYTDPKYTSVRIETIDMRFKEYINANDFFKKSFYEAL